MYYNLQDFREIANAGFSYKLPIETVDIIQELCHDMNTNFHPTKLRDFSRPPAAAAAPQWGRDIDGKLAATAAAVAAFKPTAKPTIGDADKKINDIRICLNKISPKNIDAQYAALLKHIAGAREAGVTGAAIVKVIFDICSLNKFYTELYSLVYSRLMAPDAPAAPEFAALLHETFRDKYLPSFENITYVDPNTDYDGFCNYNKENDNRKALTTFFISCAKLGAFNQTLVLECINRLLALVSTFIREENRAQIVEEITENIYIFITKMAKIVEPETPEWEEIIEKIHEFAQMKHTEYPSITNRAIFKFMDIMD
jgi:hypothetical protein